MTHFHKLLLSLHRVASPTFTRNFLYKNPHLLGPLYCLLEASASAPYEAPRRGEWVRARVGRVTTYKAVRTGWVLDFYGGCDSFAMEVNFFF